MVENQAPCVTEDSTNCLWNAQEMGNGTGQSFVDLDGTVFYIENPVVHEDVFVWESIDGAINSLPFQYVMGELNGEPYQVIFWEGELTTVLPELPVALEETVEVVIAPPQQTGVVGVDVLAETGSGDVMTTAVLSLTLICAGVVAFIKARTNRTV